MKRRVVHKITPSRQSSFDQQFWPVLVALTVLSGIALGAILTILTGPWMWGSLLLLPILAATAIFLLFSLDNTRLRRSLQFAIILSLALHLFVMVFASVVNIFQNPFKPNERQVAQRKVRTIEISDQRASFVWEETNARDTPEPKVETEKQPQPTTNVQPQPIPVPETKPELNPQLTKREKTSESVPRQNRELSKLKRQTRNLQPQSSQQNTGEKLATNKTAPSSSRANEEVKSATQADAVARQSAPSPDSEAQTANAAPAPEAETKREVARTSSSPRRSNPAKPPTESTPNASASTARVRRSTRSIPIASKQAPEFEKLASATTPTPTTAEPSKSASQTTRRPEQSPTISPALTNRPKTQLSPQSQVARSAQRRPASPVQPSISNESSASLTPRRSTRDAQVAASPLAFEKPSPAPESNSTSRALNSKTLSVSRSTAGVAGVGRSENLDRFVGGMTSPASQASDSARRERTQSKPNEARMLTSSQKSDARRSIGSNRQPTSAFKAETTSAAKVAGTKIPSERTMESSAAKLDSASANHRDEVSAEKGSASVDLGPTKIVMDRASERRSGGGQPEVSQLNPESTRRSRDLSQQQPSLLAATGLDVVAPRNASSASASSEALEASEQSVVAAKTGGQSAVTAQRRSAEISGEPADQGQSSLAQMLAESRARANRFQDESSWDELEDDIDGDNPSGNKRTRIAQAPIVRSDPGTGLSRSDGRTTKLSEQPGDAPSESLATNVSRQANSAIPGSGIGKSAANVFLQAATSLPVIASAPSRRTGTSTVSVTDPDLSSVRSSKPRSRPKGSKTPTVRPSLSAMPNSNLANVSKNAGSSENRELDSTSVSVSKTDLPAMEQIQGSKLDVVADEGPAGLGIRPNEFIGVLIRPSSRDSEQLQPDLNTRFKSPRFGGMPAVNPDAVIARDAFRNRNPATMSKAAEPTTEAAIHLGLEFLARHQASDGSWSLTGFDRDAPQKRAQLDSDAAATGLALLAFQGAGYNHREFKYARQIDHAIQWLIENQDEDGGLYVPTDERSNGACRLYSHGIAALALTEAYGMTQDVRLKEPAQKAIDYIVDSQDPRKGGWRYFVQPGDRSSDTSVSGWMMMALQSGRLAGLDVDPDSFDAIEDWLEVAADPDNASVYRYNPFAEDSKGVSRAKQGRTPTPSMTSVGLLMRIYSGWERDDPRLLAGADFLIKQQLPSDSGPLTRDTYYWYYATQVLKHIDGPRWKTWNDQLRPLLTRSQEKTGELAGSWHPYKPVPDRWGQFGGRIYVTTMNLLSLEVRHRMLPLYNQGKPPKLRGSSDRNDSGTENVSINQSTKPMRSADNETTARKPSVVPPTTRTLQPKPPQRSFSIGLNDPPTVIEPMGSNNRRPILNAAVRPSDSGLPNATSRSIDPAVELSMQKPDAVLPVNRFSRPEFEVTDAAMKVEVGPPLARPVTSNVDVVQPLPDLTSSVVLRSGSRKPQLSIPTPTDIAPATATAMEPSTAGQNKNVPILVAPIQPLDAQLLDSEIQVTETMLVRPNVQRSPVPTDGKTLPGQFSRTDTINTPRGAEMPLSLAIDRATRPAPESPDTSSFEVARSVAMKSDSRDVEPRISGLSTSDSSTKPMAAKSNNLPMLDPPIQPVENEFPSNEISTTESVAVLVTTKRVLDTKADRFLKNNSVETPGSVTKSLRSTIDSPTKASSSVVPTDSELAPLTLAPMTFTSRMRESIRSVPTSTNQPFLTESNKSPIFEKTPSIASETPIDASKLAKSVLKESSDRPVVDWQLTQPRGIEIGQSNLESGSPLRSRMKQIRSKLARTVTSQLVRQPMDVPGFGTDSNRRFPRFAKPSVPILKKIVTSRMEARKPDAPGRPVSTLASASGVVTLDGESLNGAKVELVPVNGPDGQRVSVRTDESGKFRIASDPAKQAGVKPGQYKVSVTTFVESPDENVIDLLETVPAKYNTNTTLVISVSKTGPNVFKLELVSN